MSLTAEQQTQVRAIALSWLGTPYRSGQRVKGTEGGVDCAQLLIGIYSEAGIIAPFDPGYYPPDWHLHVPDERYLQGVLQYANETPPPWEVGDVLLFRGSKWPSAGHGAVYIGDGDVVHSVMGRVVEIYPLESSPLLRTSLWKGFRFRG